MPTLDFVIPVFNEDESLRVFHKSLEEIELPLVYSRHYIYVNDGSNDHTQEVLEQLADKDNRITIIQLSRNFGHQAALSAGLESATAEVIISLDGDGQHPPSLIPEMLKLYETGHDIVTTRRLNVKESGGLLKRITSRLFYHVVNAVGEVNLVEGASDFRLLSRRALNAVLQLPEYHRFYRGITAWIGFSNASISYKPAARIAGAPKYSLRKMVRLAGDGLFSFSLGPLRIALLLGLFFLFMAAAEISYVAWIFISGHRERLVPGWTSLILLLTISSAINMVLVGILGIYVGMIFHEVKRRPVYVVKSKLER